MSDNLDCDIKLTLCNNTKKYNRAKIDKLAVKCGLDPKVYSSRLKLCDAIINENLKKKGVVVSSPKKAALKRKIVEDDEEPPVITAPIPKKVVDDEDPELYVYNGKHLKDYIVKELRPIAKELNVNKYGSINRPDLVKGIKQADLKQTLPKPVKATVIVEKPKKKVVIEEPDVVIKKPIKKVVIDEEPKQKTIEELIIEAVRSFGDYNDIVAKFPKFGDLRKSVINVLIENKVDIDKIMEVDYKEIIKNEKQKMKDEINVDNNREEDERRVREEEERRVREEDERRVREEEERRVREEEERRVREEERKKALLKKLLEEDDDDEDDDEETETIIKKRLEIQRIEQERKNLELEELRQRQMLKIQREREEQERKNLEMEELRQRELLKDKKINRYKRFKDYDEPRIKAKEEREARLADELRLMGNEDLLLKKGLLIYDIELDNYKNVLVNMSLQKLRNLYNNIILRGVESDEKDVDMMINSILNYIDFMSWELLKFYMKTNKKYTQKNETNEIAIKFYKDDLSTIKRKLLEKYPINNVNILINNLEDYLEPLKDKNYQDQISVPLEKIDLTKVITPTISLPKKDEDIDVILNKLQGEGEGEYKEGEEIIEDVDTLPRSPDYPPPSSPKFYGTPNVEADKINIDNIEDILYQIQESPREDLNTDVVEDEIMKCLGLIT